MKIIIFSLGLLIRCAIAADISAIQTSPKETFKIAPDASLRFHAELRQAMESIIALPDPVDPNEPLNREIFHFNSWVAHNLINPSVNWLGIIIPTALQNIGARIYHNLIEPEAVLSNSLAGNYSAAGNSATRFALNSTLGIAGIWDIAGNFGYDRTAIGFTESLCLAGFDPGEYLVLPLIGPTSMTTASILASVFLTEWYLFETYISPLITGVASLRYLGQIPESDNKDSYLMQRADYHNYLWPNCAPYLNRKFFNKPRRELAWKDEIGQ